MLALTERHKYTGPLILAISAIVIILLGCAALFAQSSLVGRNPSVLAVVAAIFIGSLFIFISRLISIARDAARSREHELRFLEIAESSTDSILVFDAVRDEGGTISAFKFTYINSQAERMIGVSHEKMLGRLLYETFPELRDGGRFELYKQVVETGKPAWIEVTNHIFQSDGMPGRYNIRAAKLLDGLALTITDITRSAHNKEELERALSFNKSVIASSPFSIIVTDTTGIITSVNPAAEKMLWYKQDELLGRDCLELHDPQEILQRSVELSSQFGIHVPPGHQVFRLTLEKDLVNEREWTFIRKDGSRFPVQLVVTALKDSDSHITGFLGISYDLTERKRTDEYIYHIAHHDPLTGLPTRTLVRDRLQISIERAKRSQDSLAIMMIDLDNFKRVNDSLGHQAGDIVLYEIAKRLKATVRHTDTVARMGGDEFVALLPDLRSNQDAEDISQKLLAVIAKPIHIGKHEIIVTASIGIGLFPSSENADTLFKDADIAMYRVKDNGRNNFQIYTPGIGMEGLQLLKMESALHYALEANEFEILYQPQVSFADGRMHGVEALMRWNSREFGCVLPTTFIPIAEETGLIVPIGEWILLQSCKDVAALQRTLGVECSVAVNISPRQFQQKDFPATIEHALNTSGLKPEQLELEITEQLLMADSEESLEIMQRVRKLGVRFAIDDFGTGFSNMGYITRFAVDHIKIDRSFISRCDVDLNSRAVTAAIIALAHSLQIEVIAEGVESEQQVHMLRQMSCDHAQGFFYSQPVKLEDVKAFAVRTPPTPAAPTAVEPHTDLVTAPTIASLAQA